MSTGRLIARRIASRRATRLAPSRQPKPSALDSAPGDAGEIGDLGGTVNGRCAHAGIVPNHGRMTLSPCPACEAIAAA